MILLRYDQASAKVSSLEKKAGKLSSVAKEESRTAEDALKDISNMERAIPPSLKVVPSNLVPGPNDPPAPMFSPCYCHLVFRRGQRP